MMNKDSLSLQSLLEMSELVWEKYFQTSSNDSLNGGENLPSLIFLCHKECHWYLKEL